MWWMLWLAWVAIVCSFSHASSPAQFNQGGIVHLVQGADVERAVQQFDKVAVLFVAPW